MPTLIIDAAPQLPEDPVAEGRTAEVKLGGTFVLPDSVALAQLASKVVPDSVLMGSLGDGRLRVISPVRVRLEVEQGSVIAEAEGFDEFGYGRTVSEALRDLQRALVELYFSLQAEEERLGPDLRVLWMRLQETLRRRP